MGFNSELTKFNTSLLLRSVFFVVKSMTIDIDYEDVKTEFRLLNDCLFRIDRTNGGLRWKRVNTRSKKGGYCTITYKGRILRLHRLIFVLHHKRNIKPNCVVDHINGVRDDNRVENLRETTLSGNNCNKEKHRQGVPVGAVYHVGKRKFQVEIKIKGEGVYIGDFSNMVSAGNCYKIAEALAPTFKNKKEFRKRVKLLLEKLERSKPSQQPSS